MLFPALGFADTIPSCRVFIQNAPVDGSVSFNGKTVPADTLGWYTVPAGPTIVEIKVTRVVVFSASLMLDTAHERIVVLNCTSSCALLHVITEPMGATLSMNGTILSTTPYLNRFMKSGSYSIMATYPGYIPVIRRINLTTDSSTVFNFTMEPTQAFQDSLTAVKRSLKQQRQKKQRIAFGTLGIAMLAAGAYYDYVAYDHLAASQKIAEEYDGRRADFSGSYKQEYNSHREQAKNPIQYRNILYGSAGVCLMGFYLSFIF